MGTQRVTDDLDRLLELLPEAVREQLRLGEARQHLRIRPLVRFRLREAHADALRARARMLAR